MNFYQKTGHCATRSSIPPTAAYKYCPLLTANLYNKRIASISVLCMWEGCPKFKNSSGERNWFWQWTLFLLLWIVVTCLKWRQTGHHHLSKLSALLVNWTIKGELGFVVTGVGINKAQLTMICIELQICYFILIIIYHLCDSLRQVCLSHSFLRIEHTDKTSGKNYVNLYSPCTSDILFGPIIALRCQWT